MKDEKVELEYGIREGIRHSSTLLLLPFPLLSLPPLPTCRCILVLDVYSYILM